MFNYKVKVSYLGFQFLGWAKQSKEVNTIQEVIEASLQEILIQEIKIYCSGRTDKGVNANEQVFSFQLNNPIKIPFNNLINILNKRLHKRNINIIDINEVDLSFHARFSALSKTYRYYINVDHEFNLFQSNYVYQYNKKINIDKLKEAADIFVGKHDFLSFSTSDLKDTIRTINYINVWIEDSITIIEVNGNGFLRNMVRMIVASLIKYNENKITISDLTWLLENPKKGATIEIAPPNGLMLYKVFY